MMLAIRRLLLVFAVAVSLAGHAGLARAQEPSSWSRMEGVPDIGDSYGAPMAMTTITMADPYNGWALQPTKNVTLVYRLTYRDGRWLVSDDYGMPHLAFALAAVSADEAWLLGSGWAIHRTSAGWSREKLDPSADVGLEAAIMSPRGDAGWAVGSGSAGTNENRVAALLRYSDGRWERDWSVSGDGPLRAIDIKGATGWAAGNSLWRYADGRWTQAAMPSACPQEPCGLHLYDVQTVSDREAWALASCATCPREGVVLRYRDGAWQTTSIPTGAAPGSIGWADLAFNYAGVGIAVGIEKISKDESRTVIYRFANERWTADPLIPPATPRHQNRTPVATLLATGHALVSDVDGIWTAGYAGPSLAAPLADPRNAGERYFEIVGHTLGGSFLAAWDRNGGLPVFGYPLTQPFPEANGDSGTVYATQYFERQRFEYHPENAGTPYEVLLGRLGVEVLALQGRDYRQFPAANPADPHYIPETQQAIAPQFWDYWRSRGLDMGEPGVSPSESVALFGYPISPAQVETNPDGDTVLTQWFERARFEYHPGNPPESRVVLGRLAAEHLARRGWIAQ